MKSKWIVSGIVLAIGLLLAAAGAAAQSYNPAHWFKKSPTATEELTANKDENKKLASELQALLPPKTSLNDACMAFKTLNECVASLHVSHNLRIKFACLKWSVTAVQPSGNVAACKAPENNKPMGLAKAIHLLRPAADFKTEAKSAERRAAEDIKDASS
jgi:hypothetical protein